MVVYQKVIKSPVGVLTLHATDEGLCEIIFPGSKPHHAAESIVDSDNHPILVQAEKQLAEYFTGKRKQFDVELDMRGSAFQVQAWQALQKIPYGQTISYGQQAESLGDKKKARAVGGANGRNPLSIIVPCHRVIGASGALTGFGGGLDTKEFLLNHEQRFAA